MRFVLFRYIAAGAIQLFLMTALWGAEAGPVGTSTGQQPVRQVHTNVNSHKCYSPVKIKSGNPR